MKIFFFSTVFSPSVGGIERMTETLCGEFVDMGHEVRLATLTPGNGNFPYPVIRKPGVWEFLRLLQWCDIHIQANVSLKYFFLPLIVPSKFIYNHHSTYQQDDGKRNFLDLIKLALARQTWGIANSRYTATRTGASHVVLNAYNDNVFHNYIPWENRKRELVFLGRLVSQKGCDTLLKSLGQLRSQGIQPNLTIVGDGPDRPMLEEMSKELGLNDRVLFTGTIQGQPLADLLNHHRIIVVPSRCEETFGIVALEGLACGCIPVVSERGGLFEAIGGHGFTFPNGSETELSKVLIDILQNPEVALAKLINVETHLNRCRSRNVAQQYINIFQEKIGKL
jgi:glycosyltransferase involved in cell wall biosynthesis